MTALASHIGTLPMKDRKEQVYDLLVKLCHVSTWEGENKHTAKGVFNEYVEKIDRIYKDA